MSAPEWLHCNKCFARYGPNTKFFVTTCGHVVCRNCAARIDENNNNCVICQNATKPVLLSSDLNRDMLSFFHPSTDSLEHSMNVVRFQTKNQTMLLKNILEKYNKSKAEVIKCYKIINDMKKENLKLKTIVRGHSSGQSFHTSTPMMCFKPQEAPSMSNTSVSSIRNSPLAYKRSMPGSAVRDTSYMATRLNASQNTSSVGRSNNSRTVPVHHSSPIGYLPALRNMSLSNPKLYGRH